MKLNYPVKYAAMPIIEQVGWFHGIHEQERKYAVVCYIVSKCYLISELITYKEDGSKNKEYEVVFPYQKTDINKWTKVIPSYNCIHGHCINSSNVKYIFDTYEDAFDYTVIENNKLSKDLYAYMPYSKDYLEKVQKKISDFNIELEKYRKLEQQIQIKTDDIKIGFNKKIDKVIRMKNNEINLMDYNIYNVLSLYNQEKFIVYNLSIKQYKEILKLMKEEKISELKESLKYAQCLLVHREKNEVIKLLINQYDDGYYIKDDCIFYDETLPQVSKSIFEKIDEDTFVFYTTETIEDLILSYKKYLEIDMSDANNYSLKRIKK